MLLQLLIRRPAVSPEAYKSHLSALHPGRNFKIRSLACFFTIKMTSETTPEIILYDLASVKGICFSSSVWRTRFMLNYKQIPYKTIFLEFPDIEPTLKEK